MRVIGERGILLAPSLNTFGTRLTIFKIKSPIYQEFTALVVVTDHFYRTFLDLQESAWPTFFMSSPLSFLPLWVR